MARYDGLADEYSAFIDTTSAYHRVAVDAMRRFLGPGPGMCLDIACGQGHFTAEAADLGWTVTGVDASRDQLEAARARSVGADFVLANGTSLPFGDESFDAAISTFTHTDVDDWAGMVREARRVLRGGGHFVYVGNHPCFVGATQEHAETGIPRLHEGYRRAGRWDAATAPGSTPGGWRARLGSYVHLPLGPFLEAFVGFTLVAAEELDDGYEYPKTIALAFDRP